MKITITVEMGDERDEPFFKELPFSVDSVEKAARVARYARGILDPDYEHKRLLGMLHPRALSPGMKKLAEG